MARTADSTSSTEKINREPTTAPDGVSLGRIAGAHGLRGELRVRVEADDLTNLQRVPSVRLVREEGDPQPDGVCEYEVVSAREGRVGECRLSLAGVASREAADALRGATVLARSRDLEELPPGEFYAYELVGCVVEDGSGRSVGVVNSIWDAGGRNLLVIEDAAGGQQLVPAVEPLLQEVDLEARRIVIDPPPGLLNLDASGED